MCQKHKYTPVLIDETYEVDVDFIFSKLIIFDGE